MYIKQIRFSAIFLLFASACLSSGNSIIISSDFIRFHPAGERERERERERVRVRERDAAIEKLQSNRVSDVNLSVNFAIHRHCSPSGEKKRAMLGKIL